MPDRLLTVKELAEKLSVSARHIGSMRVRGLLPPPLRLGRAVRWRADEIDAWLAAGAPCADRWVAIQRQEGAAK